MAAASEGQFKASLDEYLLIMIQDFLKFAETSYIQGDYFAAVENLDFAWERLPTELKTKMTRPSLSIYPRLRALPSNRGLNPIRRNLARDSAAFEVVQQAVKETVDRIQRLQDEAKLLFRGRRRQVSKKDFPVLEPKNVTATQAVIDNAKV